MAKKEAEGEAENKKRCKEAEGEAETEAKKKPVKREDGKLIKEPEEEEEEETEEEKRKKKLRMKEAAEEDEEEDEDETEKGELGGENPQEDAAASNQAGGTLSPNAGVPSTQNVFVPQSNVRVSRESSSGSSMGQSPSEVSYGKSANTDLLKSPLYTQLSSQIEALKKSFEKKLEAIDKSMSDRVENLQKTAKQIEAFYKQPLYKSIDEDAAAESGFAKKSIKEQIDAGKVNFSF
jgi:hypothetical protein